jgi:hypothetical protein
LTGFEPLFGLPLPLPGAAGGAGVGSETGGAWTAGRGAGGAGAALGLGGLAEPLGAGAAGVPADGFGFEAAPAWPGGVPPRPGGTEGVGGFVTGGAAFGGPLPCRTEVGLGFFGFLGFFGLAGAIGSSGGEATGGG